MFLFSLVRTLRQNQCVETIVNDLNKCQTYSAPLELNAVQFSIQFRFVILSRNVSDFDTALPISIPSDLFVSPRNI